MASFLSFCLRIKVAWSALAHGWPLKCVGVDMIASYSIWGGNGTSQYPLPKEVRTYDLALNRCSVIENVQRRALQNEDLDLLCNLFSAETALWVLPLCKGLGIPLLMSERCSPHEVETLLWNRVERIACLSIADAIHMQSVHYLYSLPDY